jgi:glucosamine--fructose-6-phosphate aminotransferase (isomerizing)
MSAMRETMHSQPEALRRVLADTGPVAPAAERLVNRRVFLVGTGTSWHAANQGAWLLRRSGAQAWAVQAADAAVDGPFPTPEDALVLMTHRGTKRYTSDVLRRARAESVPTVVISRIGNPDADLDTAPKETSSAFTASHLTALLRVGQLAVALGARLDLDLVPDAVAAELADEPAGVAPPRRLLEFAGVGINAWTAGEGALKTRETSYLATEGGACEQILHGPSVALGADDALVCLDGGGAGAGRLDDLAAVAAVAGCAVHRFVRTGLDESLSIFPLTVVVQKIAVECAEARAANPDSFGKDLPGRAVAWDHVTL